MRSLKLKVAGTIAETFFFAGLALSSGSCSTVGDRAPSSSAPPTNEALLASMTAAEKASLLVNDSPGVPRLGIPPYNWWNEALHGEVHKYAKTTVFPQPIGLGATFDADLIGRMADAIGDEARALFEDARRQGKASEQFMGVSMWSPNLNLLRDPRWGRGHETYGEDPFLIGRMGVAFVKGLQGNDPYYFKTVATPKHFVSHDGPEKSRYSFNAKVSDQDLWDAEMPGFRAAVTEGKAYSLMTSYNALNGVPMSANKAYVTDVVRGDWKFSGYVVTDCGAVGGIFGQHHYGHSSTQAAALSVGAGVDIDCGQDFAQVLPNALKRRNLDLSPPYLQEQQLDQAVDRVLTAERRLGILGRPGSDPFSKIPTSVVGSKDHQQLAVDAARESIVLLKNAGGVLPLDPGAVKKLLVVGPNADSTASLLGTYAGQPTRTITPLQALKKTLPNAEITVFKGPSISPGAQDLLANPGCFQGTGKFEIAAPDLFSTGMGSNAQRGLSASYFPQITPRGNPRSSAWTRP